MDVILCVLRHVGGEAGVCVPIIQVKTYFCSIWPNMIHLHCRVIQRGSLVVISKFHLERLKRGDINWIVDFGLISTEGNLFRASVFPLVMTSATFHQTTISRKSVAWWPSPAWYPSTDLVPGNSCMRGKEEEQSLPSAHQWPQKKSLWKPVCTLHPHTVGRAPDQWQPCTWGPVISTKQDEMWVVCVMPSKGTNVKQLAPGWLEPLQ
jgi:hypothetical protein